MRELPISDRNNATNPVFGLSVSSVSSKRRPGVKHTKNAALDWPIGDCPENAAIQNSPIAIFDGVAGTSPATVEISRLMESSEASQPIGGWRKRVMDVCVSLAAIVLTLPLVLLVALLIKATTGGPVFFAHRRIGFNAKPFYCYKFRTMVENAEDVLNDYLLCHPEAAEEWHTHQKLSHDPRITLLGLMLRKSSIDEIPQFLNVLRGEMSCVGPRPIVAEELKKYGDFAREYLQTRPGLTGLWQINGRNSVDYLSRVSMDAQYVRTWSIRSDLVILLRTSVAVFRFDQAS